MTHTHTHTAQLQSQLRLVASQRLLQFLDILFADVFISQTGRSCDFHEHPSLLSKTLGNSLLTQRNRRATIRVVSQKHRRQSHARRRDPVDLDLVVVNLEPDLCVRQLLLADVGRGLREAGEDIVVVV